MKKQKLRLPVIKTRFGGDSLITGSGTLWLTAGGRIVIDCGWGEYMAKGYGDKPICSLDDLRRGFRKKDFIAMLTEDGK